jgi:hypothetical protein
MPIWRHSNEFTRRSALESLTIVDIIKLRPRHSLTDPEIRAKSNLTLLYLLVYYRELVSFLTYCRVVHVSGLSDKYNVPVEKKNATYTFKCLLSYLVVKIAIRSKHLEVHLAFIKK